ncbi:dna topoisomerase iv subunit b [Lasius niger]|uniref:DNA topoisomerase 2 n=1 Tax=Lasius niger TaxID=67767 RepID=A0A0J7N605_LASNI|nr:dna topoisomerase iv subunit b [Lasius niger]
MPLNADSVKTAAAPKKSKNSKKKEYAASDIQILKGLEAVRKRPGMYIGGTDSQAFHHLATEILDNAMDEALGGHATRIRVFLKSAHEISISDNGRGIPVDAHPDSPEKSALEVIFTTLHAGGKFSSDSAYAFSGGLNGVGSSVVNALSEKLEVEVLRNGYHHVQTFERGVTASPLEKKRLPKERKYETGTIVTFKPDPEIFGEALNFDPTRLFALCRHKAALFAGIIIEWHCNPELLSLPPQEAPENQAESEEEDSFSEAETDELEKDDSDNDEDDANDEERPASKNLTRPTPEATFCFPNGLSDLLKEDLPSDIELLAPIWSTAKKNNDDESESGEKVDWAIAFTDDGSGDTESYCNAIPTPLGGTHINGLRAALSKGFRQWGQQQKIRNAGSITPDDIFKYSEVRLSIFLREPQFKSQTKESLTNPEAARLVEHALRDPLDHWFAGNPSQADRLTEFFIERAEERKRQKAARKIDRKSATRKLRLPGKLTDCTNNKTSESEIFLVEGESAGGSARQARDRKSQAILPLRGKILNVASATEEKCRANAELRDLTEALGCGIGKGFDIERLRYGRIIIMTDADVDGAHIASLLMTFFYMEMRELIKKGHLYLAQPPLYRLSHKGKTVYAMNDADLEKKRNKEFKAGTKVEVSRFKGLGEMPVSDLKNTTMSPAHRTLLRVNLPMEEFELTDTRVSELMGRHAEPRFRFITENASLIKDEDVDI